MSTASPPAPGGARAAQGAEAIGAAVGAATQEAPSQESEAAKSRALAPAAAAGAAPGSAAVPVTQAGEKGASRAASVSAKATSKKAKAAEAAEAAVQEYLAFHNRPFSEKDVVANLRSADATKHVQKVAVSSALNRLVQGGTATKKDFGKTSLFFSTQPQTPVDTASIYAAVVVETPKAVLQLSKTEAKIRKVEKRTEKLEAEPSNGDLDVRLDGARHAKVRHPHDVGQCIRVGLLNLCRTQRVAGLSRYQTRLREVGFGPRPDPLKDGEGQNAQTRQTRPEGFGQTCRWSYLRLFETAPRGGSWRRRLEATL